MSNPKLIHRFLKSDLFKKRAFDLNAWKEIDALKFVLDTTPEAGDVIPNGRGLRKVRMALQGRGKRGGARVIYYQVVDEFILLIDLYSKNEKSSLSADELKAAVEVRDEMLKQI